VAAASCPVIAPFVPSVAGSRGRFRPWEA
jgi:hypothetical protein